MNKFHLPTANLRALNSATKYPSIPTYHTLDPKNGGLLEECLTFAGEVIATEKVDGTNARIILCPDGRWLLGSREELLYASGDLIGNPALGIVDQLGPVAQDIAEEFIPLSDALIVIYLELYGGKIGGAARQYGKDPKLFGWRIFDVMDLVDYRPVLTWPSERISAWRDAGGQPFVDESVLDDYYTATAIPLTPRLLDPFCGDSMPDSVEGMAKMLADIAPRTRVRLDDGEGRAEGVVFRSPDRSVIAKARFQDYERTLRRRK
jgi:hypothetical protein